VLSLRGVTPERRNEKVKAADDKNTAMFTTA